MRTYISLAGVGIVIVIVVFVFGLSKYSYISHDVKFKEDVPVTEYIYDSVPSITWHSKTKEVVDTLIIIPVREVISYKDTFDLWSFLYINGRIEESISSFVGEYSYDSVVCAHEKYLKAVKQELQEQWKRARQLERKRVKCKINL
jgi:hypothetical protein